MAEGSLHTFGYHGTDLDSAAKIQETGFTSDGYPVNFAVGPNAFSMASNYGKGQASRSGDSGFAIVGATFPPHAEILGLTGDQVDIPKGIVDLGLIVVQSVVRVDMPNFNG